MIDDAFRRFLVAFVGACLAVLWIVAMMLVLSTCHPSRAATPPPLSWKASPDTDHYEVESQALTGILWLKRTTIPLTACFVSTVDHPGETWCVWRKPDPARRYRVRACDPQGLCSAWTYEPTARDFWIACHSGETCP